MSKPLARLVPNGTTLFPSPPWFELTCRTDSLAALRAAVDHGANAIRLNCRPRADSTGIGQHEFQRAGLKKAVRYARESGCTVCLEVDAADSDGEALRSLFGRAFDSGIADVSLASPALALYLRTHHPDIAIRFMLGEDGLSRRGLALLRLQLGTGRMVLPRIITLRQLQLLGPVPGIDFEVQVHGTGCALVAGRGQSQRERPSRKQDGCEPCAGDESACNDSSFSDRAGAAPDPLSLLPELQQAGVRGLIIEAPTRSPARMAELVARWREEIDRRRPALAAAFLKLTPAPG